MKRITCAPKIPDAESGAFVTYKGTVLQKPLRQTYYLNSCYVGVRDRIIKVIEENHKGDAFAAPFIKHLKKLGIHKLDIYSEIEFNITEYNVNLLFKMSREIAEEMTYTLPDLSLEPDLRLCDPARRRWFGIF
jgi:hypothetical protein